jgi:hypothetical protein
MRPTTKTRTALFTTALVTALSVPALAYQCESFITLIDQKMADQDLSNEQMAELKRLRDEGQKLHEQGQHEASMEALAKAERMLVPKSP